MRGIDAAWDDPAAARDVARRLDNFASAAEHYPAEDWVLDAVEVNAERLLDANQALQVAIES